MDIILSLGAKGNSASRFMRGATSICDGIFHVCRTTAFRKLSKFNSSRKTLLNRFSKPLPNNWLLRSLVFVLAYKSGPLNPLYLLGVRILYFKPRFKQGNLHSLTSLWGNVLVCLKRGDLLGKQSHK